MLVLVGYREGDDEVGDKALDLLPHPGITRLMWVKAASKRVICASKSNRRSLTVGASMKRSVMKAYTPPTTHQSRARQGHRHVARLDTGS